MRRLARVMGAPDRLRSFELHSKFDEVVTAKATWIPSPVRRDAEGIVEEFAEFELVRRDRKPELTINVGVDLGLMPAQLEAIQGLLSARTEVDRVIESIALQALCEV